MAQTSTDIRIRPLDELDIEDVVGIDEKISGLYRPEDWERRIGYYLRRDPEASVAAEADGRVVGFMLGEVRSGEFGLDETTGWIEVMGVDPEFRGRSVGRQMADAMLDHFRTEGATQVRTLVDETMDEVAAFFDALGFEPSNLKPFIKAL